MKFFPYFSQGPGIAHIGLYLANAPQQSPPQFSERGSAGLSRLRRQI